jgi:hypothetical protein
MAIVFLGIIQRAVFIQNSTFRRMDFAPIFSDCTEVSMFYLKTGKESGLQNVVLNKSTMDNIPKQMSCNHVPSSQNVSVLHFVMFVGHLVLQKVVKVFLIKYKSANMSVLFGKPLQRAT